MKRFIEGVIFNHIAILFTLAVLIVFSIFIYFQLPKDVFPNAEFPRIQVLVDIGFASLEDTDLKVTRPLENVLKTIPGVTSVRSATERGASTIDVYFNWGTGMDESLQYVQTKISEVRGEMPQNASIQAIKMSTSAYPFSEYGFWSDKLDQRELHTILQYNIIPVLIGIDGIYNITLIGGEIPEIWIKLKTDQLTKYNIDTLSIANAVENANQLSFIGNVSAGKKTYFGLSGKQYKTAESFGNIVVATRMGRPVYLKDIAYTEINSEPPRRLVRINGNAGAIIDISKQEGSDSLKISKLIDNKLEETCKHLNLRFGKWDLSDFVQDSISGILIDIGLAVIIILLIVFYILEKFRYSLPVILVLPLVVILEVIILKFFGQTVNIMTLGGVSAAIGIVADNAIVVTENYVRYKTSGKVNPLSASIADIFPIMFWATMVTIAVFIPLNFMSGIVGLFFKPLSFTLASTIALSLLASVIVTPLFINYFASKNLSPAKKERIIFVFLKKAYLKLLNISLRVKWIVVIALVFLVIGGIASLNFIPNGFLPEWDEGMIVFDYIAPAGSSLTETASLTKRVEANLSKEKDIEFYIRKIGTHLGTPYAQSNIGEIVVKLSKDRKKSTFVIMKELSEEVGKDIPELDTDFHQILGDRLSDLSGSGKPVSINILGSDNEEVYRTAELVKNKLEKIKGLDGVMIDLPAPQEEIKVNANQPDAFLLGMNVGDISAYSVIATYGDIITSVPSGVRTIPVRLTYENSFNLNNLKTLPVYTPNGGFLPLSKLAGISLITQNTEIHHKNGSIIVSVNSEISGRSLGSIISDVKQALKEIKNDKVTIELSGNYKSQQESFRQLLIVLAISVILILGLLLFIFESYRTALSVFIGTVSSSAFVLFGLAVFRTEFDISSFAGMITVMGLVVNNGILVVKFIENFHSQNKSIIEAIKEAGEARFRPVLITNLAAIAGFIPMAFNIGKGGEILQPFSIAMVSGLIASMLFSLIVMPVLYAILHNAYDK